MRSFKKSKNKMRSSDSAQNRFVHHTDIQSLPLKKSLRPKIDFLLFGHHVGRKISFYQFYLLNK
jgi:hypothetical protein